MTTEKQLEANRLNAQKSTGPKTDAGKKRSALNACRHGLTGQVVVLPEEDLLVFTAFISEIIHAYNPYDAVERQLAQSYANYQWRINRAASVEDAMFSLGLVEEVAENLNLEHSEAHNALSNAKTFRIDAAAFDRLSMYNQRLVNQSEKVLKQLTQAQQDRRERVSKELIQAVNIYKLHKAENAIFDPRKNGFDLTLAQVEAQVRRENLQNREFVKAEIKLSRATAA